MSDLNRVILIGRLVKDVELRNIPTSNRAVAHFRIAVSRPPNSKGEKETDFIDVVTWDKQAEQCSKYIYKGYLVSVEGRLQIREFNTQDGQRKRVAEVVANKVYFLKPPKSAEVENSESSEGYNQAVVSSEDDILNENNPDINN